MDLNSILGGLAPIAGGALGTAFGGPVGGFLGSAGGNLLGNWLGGGSNANTSQQQTANNPLFYNQLQDAQSNLFNQLQQRPQFQREDISPMLRGVENDFQERVVPSILNRFSGMGQGGLRSSSFRNALASAGSGLSQKLAELQASHAQDQQSKMLQSQGMDLSRLGVLSNLINNQQQLGLNQNQFNQQQNSWLPWVNTALNAAGIGANYLSGNQNRMQNAQQQATGIVNNAQNAGLGRQFETQYHPASSGLFNALPNVAVGAMKTLMGR